MIEAGFTKQHTQIAKGFAIILMLFDHLYWMDYGKYSALIKLPNGQDIPWMIGSIGNICVAMFLFLSGYGMYVSTKKKIHFGIRDALIRIKNLYVQYLLITTVIIILDLIFGKIGFEPLKIILNILALNYTYNKFAWFMITYIVIMLVFPITHFILQKCNWILEVIIILCIKGGITVLYSLVSAGIDIPEIIYKVCFEPFMFFPVFLIGYFCAKHLIMEKSIEKIRKKPRGNVKIVMFMIFGVTLLFMFLVENTIFDNITAPLLVFSTAYLLKGTVIEKIVSFMGRHSTNMWLIHYPIMVTLLADVIYAPSEWLLILIWLIILMLPFCYGIDWVMKKIVKR